jgi:apolipoprotein N-acyltransferase
VLGAGGALTTYAKQHLIPGLEDWITPGDADLIVGGRFGVAICKDLDFPALVRRYRSAGAVVMLAPALDFTSDGWLHSRMALVRGVESGLTVVRAAAYGRLTVTDPRGRVLGEARAGNAELLVTMPASARATVYTRTGDWFPVLALPLLALAGHRAARGNHHLRSEGPHGVGRISSCVPSRSSVTSNLPRPAGPH